MVEEGQRRLYLKLTTAIARFIEGAGSDERFGELALALFTQQSARFPALARYAAARSRAPSDVSDWREIPPLPAAAFKYATWHDGLSPVVRTFESSGTSGAPRSQSAFSTEGLALMDLAIDAAAGRWLFPDGARSTLAVLAPSPDDAPAMIMAYGMRRLIDRFGLPGSRFLVGPGGLETASVLALLREAELTGAPLTLIGATFGFVHLLDGLRGRGERFTLPPGSRTLDAGGFKGRSRVVTREALSADLSATFGVPEGRHVNLLGLTELASQFYDGTLAGGGPRKQNAHWTRTRVLDPVTLTDARPGELGLLAHWDLANVERPFAVLTDDLGRMYADGFVLVGRTGESDAKGCSITLDELLGGSR